MKKSWPASRHGLIPGVEDPVRHEKTGMLGRVGAVVLGGVWIEWPDGREFYRWADVVEHVKVLK